MQKYCGRDQEKTIILLCKAAENAKFLLCPRPSNKG